MAGVITASDPSRTAPSTGLSPRQFGKLVTALRREGADPVRKGRPWSPPLEDRVLLVAAYWRTNLTLRQPAPLFGISESAADRIVDHLGPALAPQPRKRFHRDTALIVDGTLVPTRDHTVAGQSKNSRYSTNHQVVVDADTRLVVAVGRPLPGNRNDCKARELYGAKDAVGRTTVIADGGYRGTGLLIPHRRDRGATAAVGPHLVPADVRRSEQRGVVRPPRGPAGTAALRPWTGGLAGGATWRGASIGSSDAASSPPATTRPPSPARPWSPSTEPAEPAAAEGGARVALLGAGSQRGSD